MILIRIWVRQNYTIILGRVSRNFLIPTNLWGYSGLDANDSHLLLTGWSIDLSALRQCESGKSKIYVVDAPIIQCQGYLCQVYFQFDTVQERKSGLVFNNYSGYNIYID